MTVGTTDCDQQGNKKHVTKQQIATNDWIETFLG